MLYINRTLSYPSYVHNINFLGLKISTLSPVHFNVMYHRMQRRCLLVVRRIELYRNIQQHKHTHSRGYNSSGGGGGGYNKQYQWVDIKGIEGRRSGVYIQGIRNMHVIVILKQLICCLD